LTDLWRIALETLVKLKAVLVFTEACATACSRQKRGWKDKAQGGALNKPTEVSIQNNKNIFVKNEVTVCGSS
jgi:hypothetical protein